MKNTYVLSLVAAFSLLSGGLAQTTPPAATGTPSPGAPPSAAAVEKPVKKETPETATKPAGFPFRGTLKAVDKAAMTLTIAGQEKDRVVYLTNETKFTKDGKPVTLADAVVNGEVGGYARKGKDGRTEAISVRFGPAVKAAKKPAKAASTKPDKAGAEPMP